MTPSIAALIERLEVLGLAACWPWPRKIDATGRGRVWVGGKIKLAHRAVWEQVNGPIPMGKLLCHHCDNPSCVNPAHVYVGTHTDNMRDMSERKRAHFSKRPDFARQAGHILGKSNTWARGERNPKAKLTPIQVAEIRMSNVATRFLASQYQVDRTIIQRIRKGTLWV